MQATQSIPTAKPKSHAESFTALRRQASEHEKAGRWEQAAACWMQASEVAGSANPADVASKLVWGEYQRDAAARAAAARTRATATSQ